MPIFLIFNILILFNLLLNIIFIIITKNKLLILYFSFKLYIILYLILNYELKYYYIIYMN